ncbi:MAG: CPBP family intramembrane metalloprotease [candidate division WOR-3 bacterium]|nr:MAG: CPBP family intramembrane metalloprotease [candidate division WOR-3 bacterium]
MKENIFIKDIMTVIKAFIQRNPVLAYFILTVAISWGGVLLVIGGPSGILGIKEQFETLLPIVILVLLAGPSVAGVLLTGLVDGRAGLNKFRLRLFRWRVGARWYAVALLTTPLLMMAIYLALSHLSLEFLPGIFTADDKVSHLLMGLATGLMAGIFEELGWTGFAIPRLRQRYSVLTTGLIVGFLWAIWHILPALWLGFASGTINGTLSLISYLLDPFLFLVAFRMLMVWVYDRTGSLLVGMLMHVSLTGSARIFAPLGIVGVPLLIFDITWAAVMWAVVAVVALVNRGKDSNKLRNE